jgi:hypothetical protein
LGEDLADWSIPVAGREAMRSRLRTLRIGARELGWTAELCGFTDPGSDYHRDTADVMNSRLVPNWRLRASASLTS